MKIAIILFLLPFLPIIAYFVYTIIDNFKSTTENKNPKIICSSDEDTCWSCHFREAKRENRPCFTFDQIKTFYYTAPEKWRFATYEFYYCRDNNYFKKVAITTPSKEDYVLTLRFFKEQEKTKQKQEQIQATLDLLPYLREDARKAQDEADKMLAKCEEDIQNIAKNLEREKRLTYENSTLM